MKTALITGASRGIGKAIAEVFSKAGYRVIINYNNSKAQAKELCSKLAHSHLYQADISDSSQVKAMFDHVTKSFGGADVLVNNAGISYIGVFQLMEDSEIERLVRTDFTGAVLCSKYALKAMIPKKSGIIINISSMWGDAGASCEAVYSAAKAGIMGFTKALAKEVGQSGIRVNCISPGVIDTDMNRELSHETIKELISGIPLKRMGKPEEIAKIALFLASDDSSYLNGVTIGANGGMVM